MDFLTPPEKEASVPATCSIVRTDPQKLLRNKIRRLLVVSSVIGACGLTWCFVQPFRRVLKKQNMFRRRESLPTNPAALLTSDRIEGLGSMKNYHSEPSDEEQFVSQGTDTFLSEGLRQAELHMLRHGEALLRIAQSFGPEHWEHNSDSDTFMKYSLLADLDKEVQRRRLQMMLDEGGPKFGRIDSLEPSVLGLDPVLGEPDVKTAPFTQLFGVNDEVTDLSYINFGLQENLLVTQKRGAIYLYKTSEKKDDVLRDAKGMPMPAPEVFGSHSCLKVEAFCAASASLPMVTGFFVLDRHRILRYNYTWLPPTDADPAMMDQFGDVRVKSFGQMNIGDIGGNGLFFPTALAEYRPQNITHISETQLVTNLFPDAAGSFLFVTDTGNHRVVIMNITQAEQLDYYGQFGMTGVAGSNRSCLNSPWGLGVYAPAWESRFQPIFANIFVADSKNHRLVKLDFGHPQEPYMYNNTWVDENLTEHWRMEKRYYREYGPIRLGYSGHYGTTGVALPEGQGLNEPTAVSCFRHYVFVVASAGKAIIVVTVDYLIPTRMTYVTHLYPVDGVKLVGSFATSPFGYLWYIYVSEAMQYSMAAARIPMELSRSLEPDVVQDLMDICINQTYYNTSLAYNDTGFYEQVSYFLNATAINYLFPDESGFVNITTFNLSHMVPQEDLNVTAGETHGFNFEQLNSSVFGGRMTFCPTPPPPEAPVMMHGNPEGWVIGGQSQKEIGARTGFGERQAGANVVLQCLFLFSSSFM